MNFDFLKTRRRLLREIKELRAKNRRQYELILSKAFTYEAGFDAAMQVNNSEMANLHKEIRDLNDLLRSK